MTFIIKAGTNPISRLRAVGENDIADELETGYEVEHLGLNQMFEFRELCEQLAKAAERKSK